ncbi:MAG: putative membrane protein YedE/YeeE [Bradymonadia bacterium]|jgi:uncharacterized membrane protein YedE/YeeE
MMSSILMATAGGALIGLAASMMLFFHGRIAGISGIMGSLLTPVAGDVSWRVSFLIGLLAGGLALLAFYPTAFASPVGRSLIAVGVAGFLVGVGTRLGSGCTSGHGVCGLSRVSRRSFSATLTFTVTGVIAATAFGALTGGAQ